MPDSPGSAAAKELSVVERREHGLQGGAIGQVFVTAMVVARGENLLSSIGGEWPEILKPNVRRVFLSLGIRLPF